MPPTVTVRGYDANNNYLGVTDTHTLEAISQLPATYTPSCNPTSSQLSGYIYDDNHFVLTLISSDSHCNPPGASAAKYCIYE